MFTRTLILSSLLFLISFNVINAQPEPIERLFRGDRQNTGVDAVGLAQGYLILSAGRPLDSTNFKYYTVTKVDEKTNFVWSKDYSFERNVIPDGSITLLPGEEFIISGVLDTSSVNKVLLKGDASGEVVWTQGFGRDDADEPLIYGDAPVSTSHRGYFIAGDAYNNQLSSDVYLSHADTAGVQLWAKSYNSTTLSTVTSAKVEMAQDSGAIVCGTAVTGLDANISIIKTDSLGNIEWSREYGEPSLAEFGTAVAPTPDGGYLIGGRKINPLLPSHPGLLIKTDTFGNTQWVFNVDFQTSDTILINDIIIASDGNAVISGSLLGAVDNFAYMMKISLDGDVVWKRRYKASTRQSLFSNGLGEAAGGYLYLTSSDELVGMNEEQVGPYLIRTDGDGQTLCDSIVDGQLLFPTMVTIDTLIFTETDLMDDRDILVVDTMNYNFNLVILQLEQFGPYCPEEMFSDTLDATTDGAIAYEWSTGETTPTIVVSEFDEYKVTVTIGVDYCYQLCAMTTIAERPLPEIELSFNDDDFCDDGDVLIASETSNTDMILWSNNETTNNIIVTQEGRYVATATNVCASVSDSIDIVFDTSPPGVTASEIDEGDYCTNGTTVLLVTADFGTGFDWSTGDSGTMITVDALGSYTVTVTSNFCEDGIGTVSVDPVQIEVSLTDDNTFCADGDGELLTTVSNGNANSYEWSTGETSPTITVMDQMEYSVTVSNFCGNASAVYTIPSTQIGVEILRDSGLCRAGEELLTAFPSNGTPNAYTWSTGETTPTITVNTKGDYALTVTDFCGSAEDTELVFCPIEYELGNTFTPNGDNLSEIFIPEFTFDPSELVEYEFAVYSRWGDKIFETSNPEEGWDGTVNEEPGVSDVYFYTISGMDALGTPLTYVEKQKENHGDVTLVK